MEFFVGYLVGFFLFRKGGRWQSLFLQFHKTLRPGPQCFFPASNFWFLAKCLFFLPSPILQHRVYLSCGVTEKHLFQKLSSFPARGRALPKYSWETVSLSETPLLWINVLGMFSSNGKGYSAMKWYIMKCNKM